MLTTEELFQERHRLLTRPKYKRTFLIGPFTSLLDPLTGVMQEDEIILREAIHKFYEERGVDCYSSFRRECYGSLRIENNDATLLDKLTITTSHVLTVLPGSSKSTGSWEEIRYGGALGRSFLFLFRNDSPETEFQQTLRRIVANFTTRPYLAFITYDNFQDLFEQMEEVWKPLLKKRIPKDVWADIIDDFTLNENPDALGKSLI